MKDLDQSEIWSPLLQHHARNLKREKRLKGIKHAILRLAEDTIIVLLTALAVLWIVDIIK